MQHYNNQKHIQMFYVLLIPIIIVAKVVRYTVMYAQLISMSIGFGMVSRINRGRIVHFHASILSEATSAGSVAATNAEALCSYVNFFGMTSYYEWEIFFTVVFNLWVAKVVADFYRETPKITIWTNLFIYTAVAMLNMFALNMSKEPYQMLFFFLMAYSIKKGKNYKMKFVWLTAAIIITVLFCRKYYGLVFIYFAFFQMLIQHLFRNIDTSTSAGRNKVIQGLFIMVFFIALFQHLFMGVLAAQNEQTYNEMLIMNHRDQNRASAAQSEIVPFFGTGNPVLVTVDYVLKIFRLLCPIELLIKGKVKYLFIIAFQGLLSYFLFRAFMMRNNVSKVKDDDEEEEEETDEEETDEEEEEETKDLVVQRIENGENQEEEDDDDVDYSMAESQDRIDNRTMALYLYLAFLLCSAAFEPDFGSWTRHESVTLPILLLLL